jgi:hypothetical protein
VRAGDLSVKLMMKFAANVRFETIPGKIDLDDSNRPYLEEGDDGTPLIRNGHYIVRKYDFWIVISVLKRDIWMGLPPLHEFLGYCVMR